MSDKIKKLEQLITKTVSVRSSADALLEYIERQIDFVTELGTAYVIFRGNSPLKVIIGSKSNAEHRMEKLQEDYDKEEHKSQGTIIKDSFCIEEVPWE